MQQTILLMTEMGILKSEQDLKDFFSKAKAQRKIGEIFYLVF